MARPSRTRRRRHSSRAIFSVGLLLLLVAAVVAAVLLHLGQPSSHRHDHLLVVLGDTSFDATPALRLREQEVLRDAASQMHDQQGTVDATWFDGRDAQSISDWHSRTFELIKSSDSALVSDQFHGQLSDYDRETHRLFLAAHAPSAGTDVASAIAAAATESATFPGIKSHVLIIVSNMAQDGEGISLKTVKPGSNLASLVKRLDVPNLQGTCVYVVDPGAVGGPGFPPLRPATEAVIRRFWSIYFGSGFANAAVKSWGDNLSWPVSCDR